MHLSVIEPRIIGRPARSPILIAPSDAGYTSVYAGTCIWSYSSCSGVLQSTHLIFRNNFYGHRPSKTQLCIHKKNAANVVVIITIIVIFIVVIVGAIIIIIVIDTVIIVVILLLLLLLWLLSSLLLLLLFFFLLLLLCEV